MARTINQIARSANRKPEPDDQTFIKERTSLGRELAKVQGPTQIILDVAPRREDGLARLDRAGRVD